MRERRRIRRSKGREQAARKEESEGKEEGATREQQGEGKREQQEHGDMKRNAPLEEGRGSNKAPCDET